MGKRGLTGAEGVKVLRRGLERKDWCERGCLRVGVSGKIKERWVCAGVKRVSRTGALWSVDLPSIYVGAGMKTVLDLII